MLRLEAVTVLPILDTQLISFAAKGLYEIPRSGAAVSSTTAQELLLVQSDNPVRNNYYVPVLANGIRKRIVTNDYLAMHRNAPQKFRAVISRHGTDRYVLDFYDDFPTVVEYSHLALANAINRRNFVLLRQLASALDDKRRRVAVRRLRFLLDNDIRCVPLGVTSAELGLSLFHRFVSKFAPKGNFRNSLNDILTLAVAHHACTRLHTDDRLLAQFATDQCGIPVNQDAKIYTLDFRRTEMAPRRNQESKGYINRTWRVRSSVGLPRNT